MKFFKNGKAYEYDGPRDHQGLLHKILLINFHINLFLIPPPSSLFEKTERRSLMLCANLFQFVGPCSAENIN